MRDLVHLYRDPDPAGGGGGGDPAPGANDGNPPPEPKGGAAPKASDFSVPDDFKDREWAKNIKDQTDLFNQFDNAQKMIGKKRIALPNEKSTPEEIAEYHKAIGVPDTAEEYEFEQIEALKNEKRDEAMDAKLKQIFKDRGVPKDLAKQLVKDYEQAALEEILPEQEKKREADKAFEAYLDETYGAEKDKKVADFKEALKQVDEKIAAQVDQMDDAASKVLMALVDDLHQKFGKEGSFLNKTGRGDGGSGKTQSQLFQELTELHAKYAGVKPMTPEMEAYKAAEARIRADLEKVVGKHNIV